MARLRSRRRTASIDPEAVDFFAAIPSISPHLAAPTWLAPLVDVLRRMFLASAGYGPPVFACCSVPPQHGKTLTIEHAMAEWLRHRPQDPLVYATYNRDLAREKNREIRDLSLVAGVDIRDDSRNLDTWTTTAGGGVRARGIVGGALTGTTGLRAIIVDDPYKGRREAESAASRRDVWQSFQANIVSRLHRRTSVLVNHTRWHELDLTGRLMKEQPDKWEFVNLPAINDDGEPLWPEGMPLDLLQDKRERGGEYEWWSLYMGQPRPREGKVFSGVSYFQTMPSHHRVAIGVDLAYTAKKASDWSVAVVMAESYGAWYVLDVVRRQCTMPEFASELKALHARHAAAPMVMYAANWEKKNVETMQRLGVPLAALPTVGDKFVRAQPLSGAWRAGKVSLMQGADWIAPYTDSVLAFTGLGDEQDDDVDATAAAFDALPASTGDAHAALPQSLLETRPRRDPALRTKGRGRLGSW